MSFLLILSALLSALTGVQVGARAPAPAMAMARAADVTVARPVRAVGIPGRPVAVLPRLVAVAALAGRPGWRLAASAPLWASRRRE